jgi:hypothetical protein
MAFPVSWERMASSVFSLETVVIILGCVEKKIAKKTMIRLLVMD